jgi:predicted permease
VRHLLIESLLVAMTGGVLGLLLAMWTINGANLFIPEMPMNATMTLDFGLDFNLLSFTLGISVLTGVVFGLFPALQATRTDLIPALKDEGAGAIRFKRSRLRSSLVVAQVAASLVLLIASGLFVRSLLEAKTMDPGFSHENTLALSLDFARYGYDDENGRAYCDDLLARVRELPGVEAAAFDGSPPLGLDYMKTSVWIEGDTATDEDGSPIPRMIRISTVSPDALKTLEIPVLMGREFDERDRADSREGLIVNQTFAETFWPGENPLSKGIAFTTQKVDDGWGPGDYQPIVGVVGTVDYLDLGETPQPAVYTNISHSWDSSSILLVRTTGDPLAMLPVVRDVMRDTDPNFAPSDSRTFTSLISFKLMPAKLAASLAALFGALALGLAMIGLYGVMAYMVSQRTHEIGIRMAIGPEKSDVLKLVMRQGLILTGLGLGIGLVIALGFAQALKSMLYGVSPADPLTFASIALLLVSVAILALLIPARRAMKVDPMVALRYE